MSLNRGGILYARVPAPAYRHSRRLVEGLPGCSVSQLIMQTQQGGAIIYSYLLQVQIFVVKSL